MNDRILKLDPLRELKQNHHHSITPVYEMQGNECTQNLRMLNAVCKSPRNEGVQNDTDLSQVISAHGNASPDNALSKAGALLQTQKMEWFKNMNERLLETNGDDKGVTVVSKKRYITLAMNSQNSFITE